VKTNHYILSSYACIFSMSCSVFHIRNIEAVRRHEIASEGP